MNQQRTSGLGLAVMKREGEETDFDPGMPETPKQKTARIARQTVAHEAMRDFVAAVEHPPETITPRWLAMQYALAQLADDRGAITYLRRLVLWRTASGRIEHPQECAALVMPDGERSFSTGW